MSRPAALIENRSRMLSSAVLTGHEGDLVLVRITLDAKLLEEVLEALTSVSFPVNPQLLHKGANTTVEFPAYSSRLDEVRQLLADGGFESVRFETVDMLAAIQAQGSS
jgi:hypothetical protein